MAALLTSMVVLITQTQIFAKDMSKQLGQHLQTLGANKSSPNQVLVFVLCHSLKAGLNIYEAYMVI